MTFWFNILRYFSLILNKQIKRKLDYIELFVLDGSKGERRFYENNDFVPVIHTLRCML
jgi:hypothetical protein